MSEQSSAQVGKGLHVAIIMDGNGRWAAARGLPRLAGHKAGGEAVKRTIEAACKLGIQTLTLYAFSSDNWRRPPEETSALMSLLEEHLQSETPKCVENGIRLNIIGRRDRLPPSLVAAIERAEAATIGGDRLYLRVAVDYSSRDSIVRAAALMGNSNGHPSWERFAELLARVNHGQIPVPEVDLLIRTSGEQRLSDFLLWECAYAELIFIDKMWPDFGAEDLERALEEFRRRERRFGGLSPVRPDRPSPLKQLNARQAAEECSKVGFL